MDREFTTLLSKISPSVPGCPRPLILQAARDAAIRVCERTLLWRYTPPKFDLLPGVHEYFYEKPINTDVHALFDAMVNDTPLERLTLEQALYAYPAWADLYSGESPETLWSETPESTFNSDEYNEAQFNQSSTFTMPAAVVAAGSEPRSVCQLTPDKYVVLPMPDDAKTYTMRLFCALKPKRNATGMDSNVLDELEDVIVHAALQQLLVMGNVVWSDRELAAYHAKQALYHATERRARANLGNARGVMTVRAPLFA